MTNRVLAKALTALKKVQDKEGNVFKSEKLDSKSITVLKEHNYLFSIINGWYCIQAPSTQIGDTSIWYVNAWLFFSKYLNDRFGKKNYCLNPHNSLMIHTQKNTIPKQLTVLIKNGASSSIVKLPNNMSLFTYEDKQNFPKEFETKRGVNIFKIEDVICKSDTNSFINYPLEMEIALKSIRDVSTIINSLISLKRMDTSAARLSGAYTYLGRENDAKNIQESYTSLVGIKIKPFNPFSTKKPIFSNTKLERSPYASRVEELWKKYSSNINEVCKEIKLKNIDAKTLLTELEEKYTEDAYHSLSIEGYMVTTELIDKIKNGNWNPTQNAEDAETKDALAAKGYYEAFEELKSNILKSIESGEKIENIIPELQSKLYRKMFLPSVQANILKPSDLIGYRDTAIYLRGSEHVPPPKEAVLDAMEKYFEVLKNDDNILSKAILGHFIFGFIHPYIDGNGRISRFIMNTILISYGLPWIIIKKEERNRYMSALEQASNHDNIIPFTEFILEKIEHGKLL
jgi:Fic family protein